MLRNNNVDVLEIRKHELHDNEDLAVIEGQRDGKFSQNSNSYPRVTKSKFIESWVKYHVVHLGINVSSSTHSCGCVVDGCNSMAAI